MEERKPLAPHTNMSRLPVSGVRMKRALSPNYNEASISNKKARMDSDKIGTEMKTTTKSISSSSLSISSSKSTVTRKIRRSVSTSNLMKRPVCGTVSSNKGINTVMAPRNTKPQVRGISSTVVKPKPTGAVNGKPAFLNNSALNSTVTSTGGPKKRPGWDLKGRIQDMEAQMQMQKQEKDQSSFMFSQCNERIGQLESQNQQLSKKAVQKEMASEAALKEIHNLQSKLSQTEEELDSAKKKFQREIENLEFHKSALERHKITLEGELNATVKEMSALKVAIAELTSSQATIQSHLDSAKETIMDGDSNGEEFVEFNVDNILAETPNFGAVDAVVDHDWIHNFNEVAGPSGVATGLFEFQLKNALNDITQRNGTIAEKSEAIMQRDASIALYQQKERDHETERRKLHNTIQELKGNIRVFCRVRPLLGEEQLGNGGIISHMNFPDMDMKILELVKLPDISVNESVLNATRGSKGVSKYEFSFDKVFQPESTQSEVFEEMSQLIQSALDGYNVCIFAYGQTGSGKTFTMEGALNDESTLGMIPRTVKQIFRVTSDLQTKGWEYTFQVSMLEIYNETIQDLLGKGKEEKLEIKIQTKGDKTKADNEVYVPNLTVVDVTSENKVLSLLKTATKNRAVAETKCNDRSSRSHSVFQLRLTGSNTVTAESCRGMLNLVDLAGSERIKASGSEGQRLVEAQCINKSLSNLSKVILALGKKAQHIPYRDSKLTYLLQNSLGGNSKTLMFVNVSPKEECFSETLTSLRFATEVNQCNIGTAQKRK